MDYAVIATGGKQYRVSPGMLLDVELLEGEPGARLRLEEVLAVRQGEEFHAGTPNVTGAAVEAEIVAQTQGPKLISFKFKRRKGYHRKVGHRQQLTRLKILEIRINGAH